MQQKLTTTPLIFLELSFERLGSTSGLGNRFNGQQAAEILILAVLTGLAGTVCYELLFLNSEAMQIVQSMYHLLCCGHL